MTGAPMGLTLEVRLWIAPGEAAGFRAFEDRALAIMAEHGAQVEVRPGSATPGAPDEIHEITFPDPAAFAAYRADPRLVVLADLRARVVARTEIIGAPDP